MAIYTNLFIPSPSRPRRPVVLLAGASLSVARRGGRLSGVESRNPSVVHLSCICTSVAIATPSARPSSNGGGVHPLARKPDAERSPRGGHRAAVRE